VIVILPVGKMNGSAFKAGPSPDPVEGPINAVASPSTMTIAPISKLAAASVEAITVAVPTVGTELTERLFAVAEAATVNTPDKLIQKMRPPLIVKIVWSAVCGHTAVARGI